MENKDKADFFAKLIILFILVAICIIIVFPTDKYRPEFSKEVLAICNLRTLFDSQTAFQHVEGGFAITFEELRDDMFKAGKPAYLDIDFSRIVDGYKYTLKPAGDSRVGKNGSTVYTNFECIAEPKKYGPKSNWSFCIDSSGIIRRQYGKAASVASEPVKSLEQYR